MSRLKNFGKKNWIYITAFILPLAIAFIHSFVADTWITGNGNFAIGDMQAQIIPICYELWDKIHLGDSLSYTWHLADGCDFNALIGYLFSPFTIIMLLLPRNCIPDFMQLIMIIKWAFVSVSMVYFFYHTKHNTLQYHKKEVSLFLGLAYALGNAVLSYILYVQFMDVLFCFPFLLLLVEKLVEKKKWKLYYLLLTFCIMSNYYITFQICIFLVLWFFLQLASETEEKGRKFAIFAGSSVLSAVTAAVCLLTGVVLAQGRLSNQSVADKTEYMEDALISIQDFVKQFFIFEPIVKASDMTPNVYFSVLAALLVLLFLFIKISGKRKIYMLSIAFVFVASFFAGPLSLVWHLFNVPNGVYHRFMYLFVFFMLFLTLYVLVHMQDIQLKHVLIIFAAAIVVSVYTFFKIKKYDSYIVYLVTAMLLILYIFLMISYCRKSITYKHMLLVIAICGILEVSANAYYVFGIYDAELYFGEGGVTEAACELLDHADLSSGERMVASNPTSDLGMVASKNADSGFVSAINVDNKRLHEKLGMASNSNVEFLSRGASPLVNLLFNIRYGLGESEMLFSDVELVDKDEFLQLYRMNRLAGLGYMVDDRIIKWNSDEKNCFQFQNDFVEKAVGEEPVFSTIDTDDIRCQDVFGKSYERDKKYIDNGVYAYTIDNQYGNEFDSLQLDFIAKEDMDLYMYFWSLDNYNLKIFIDGQVRHQDIRPFSQSTYHIGNVKKGQKVAVCAVPAENFSIGDITNLMFTFGKFDEGAYAKAYEKLSRNVYDIEVEESDYIKGSIQADKDGIMMTSIQAVDGFTVYVDGKETEYEVIGGAMIGIPLKAGTHTVEFRYRTPYLTLGMCVSGGAFLVFLLICLMDWRKNKADRRLIKEQ